MKTIKALPRIGIRPVIDGRRMGVRESLEEQTMNMAKATAALLSENYATLRYARRVRNCRQLHCRNGGIRRLRREVQHVPRWSDDHHHPLLVLRE